MTVIKLRNKKKTRVCFLFEFIQQKDGKIGKNRIFFARWTPAIYLSRVSKPAPQANLVNLLLLLLLFSYWYFGSDTCNLLVAGVPISISWKYLYLYLTLKAFTAFSHFLETLFLSLLTSQSTPSQNSTICIS